MHYITLRDSKSKYWTLLQHCRYFIVLITVREKYTKVDSAVIGTMNFSELILLEYLKPAWHTHVAVAESQSADANDIHKKTRAFCQQIQIQNKSIPTVVKSHQTAKLCIKTNIK